MIAYVITENNGEWSAARINNPGASVTLGLLPAPAWVDNTPLALSISGNTLDHAHQLDTLEDAVNHIKRWIARDAHTRLGGKP